MPPYGATADFRRILVTGCTGFVGSYLCPALRAAFPHAEGIAFCREGERAEPEGFAPLAIDLLDSHAIEKAVGTFRPDLVVHLAAQASIGQSAASAEATWRVNAGATLSLGGAVARHMPGATFFFVSSSEVYGAAFADGPASEETIPAPLNAYARSKLAAEILLGDIIAPTGRLVVVRPFNHTGPGQDARFALPAFASQIAAIEAGQRPPRLEVGNLDARRDFLDVRDVVKAYVELLRHSGSFPARNLFNVASGHAYGIGELLARLRSLSRVPFEIDVDPARLRPSEIGSAAGRSDRLRALTGWTPQIAIGATLGDLLDDCRRAAAQSATAGAP